MHYAIIAAGEGSRLMEEGVKEPKPLVPLCGQPMIARLLDILVRCKADHIAIIVNDHMLEVQQYLRLWQCFHDEVTLRIVVKSTPSSMHSLDVLCEEIPSGPFVCTTVDAIFREEEFVRYVEAFEAQAEGAFCFGITPFVEDERPLWVSTDDKGMISQFSDEGPAPYVSGGIYGMERDRIRPILQGCISSGQSRMRNFQRALLSAGIPIQGYVFEKVMDIDHKADIAHAEQWLK